MEFELFQTLDTRYEIDKTEDQGPVKCSNEKNAWLGFGYYFWEDEDLAHGWGHRHYNGVEYCVCKTTIQYSEKKCLDLVHVPAHKKKFREICDVIKSENNFKKDDDILIAEVFDYLNKFNQPWMKNFEALRVYGEKSFRNFTRQIKFDSVPPRDQARLTLNPEIQWCLLKKTSMNRTGFEVVYPDENDYICIDKSRSGFY